jgi:hypothetical protein
MEPIQPQIVQHLPSFATAPGETDGLFVFILIFLIVMFVAVGIFYLRLHALPEQMAHEKHRLQLEIVALLALISLFTHNHLFWIAALLLAFIRFPDFGGFAQSVSDSLATIARNSGPPLNEPEPPEETIAAPELPDEDLQPPTEPEE